MSMTSDAVGSADVSATHQGLPRPASELPPVYRLDLATGRTVYTTSRHDYESLKKLSETVEHFQKITAAGPSTKPPARWRGLFRRP